MVISLVFVVFHVICCWYIVLLIVNFRDVLSLNNLVFILGRKFLYSFNVANSSDCLFGCIVG
jgi:hypothetical protein